MGDDQQKNGYMTISEFFKHFKSKSTNTQIFYITIAIITILLFVGLWSKYFEKDHEVNVFILPTDSITRLNISLNYYLFEEEFDGAEYVPILVKSGRLDPELNQFNLKNNTMYLLYYGSEDYYMNKDVWFIVADENIDTTIGQIYNIAAHSIEKDITIDLTGQIKSYSENNLTLKISGQKELRHVSVCFGLSENVLNISSDDYSTTSIPKRLDGIADICFRIGISLGTHNEYTGYYDFILTTGEINNDDYLDIFIVDEDQFLTENWEWEYSIENSLGDDIGAPDFYKRYNFEYNQ